MPPFLCSELMRFFQLFIFLGVICAQCSFAAPVFTATYKGKYNGWNITLERSLQYIDQGQYALTSKASNFIGQLDETSEFNLQGNQLIPSNYSYNRKIFGKANSETVRFVWSKNEAIYTRTNKPQDNRTVKLQTGLLDPALYQLQLQLDLAHQNTTLNYFFIKRKDIKNYKFSVVGNDTFKLGKMQYRATIVERLESSAKKTRIWLLADLNWQIARIQHKEESGDTYTIELNRYSGDNMLLAAFFKPPQKP